MIRGRDVYHGQGAVNWKSMKAIDDLSFGMAKCIQGTSFFDSQYIANREGCHLAGMPFIAYGYAEPGSSSALTQAKLLVAKAGAVEGLCLDLEVSPLSQSATNAWMRSFGDILRDLTGAATFVYLGGYAANGSGQGSVDHFDHWIYPHYTVNNWPTVYAPQVGGNTTGWKVPPAPSMWQCSDNIRGVDALVSNLTLSQLFSGVDQPMTPAEIDAVALASAKATLALVTIPNGRVGDPNEPQGTDHSLATWISRMDAMIFANKAALTALTPDAIAAAVVAALPPSQGGSAPTAAEIAAEVVAQFATKLGATQ